MLYRYDMMLEPVMVSYSLSIPQSIQTYDTNASLHQAMPSRSAGKGEVALSKFLEETTAVLRRANARVVKNFPELFTA